MSKSTAIIELLRHFPGVTVQDIGHLGNAGGFSGASLWRITTAERILCLRQWPPGYPSPAVLRSLHALLRHAGSHDVGGLPIPLLHRGNDTVLAQNRRLYELTPWLPGQADYHMRPTAARLSAAMQILARFHTAVATFPQRGQARRGCSPGLAQRTDQLERLLRGELERVSEAVVVYPFEEIRERGMRILAMFQLAAPAVRRLLGQAATLEVALQPCIRDIWHDHVLFTGDQVTGLIDFGAMRHDNIACDLARLIGSLVGDLPSEWESALATYTAIRPLSADELLLIRAFDQSGVLMSGLTWLQWICVEGRRFEDPGRIHGRLDENLRRLEQLTTQRM